MLMLPASSAREMQQSQPKSPLQVECDALFSEMMDAYQRFTDGTHKAKTAEEARKFVRPDTTAYAAKFLAMAKEHPDDPAAVDATVRVILADFGGPHWKEAIQRIKARYIRSDRIGEALRLIAMDTTPPEVEPLLRDILKENPSAEVRAQSAVALAQNLKRLAEEAEFLRERPDRFKQVASKHGLEEMTRFRDRDTAAMRREAEALLERAIREYAQVSNRSHDRRNGLNPAETAAAELRSMRDLIVGKPAPEIDGRTLTESP